MRKYQVFKLKVHTHTLSHTHTWSVCADGSTFDPCRRSSAWCFLKEQLKHHCHFTVWSSKRRTDHAHFSSTIELNANISLCCVSCDINYANNNVSKWLKPHNILGRNPSVCLLLLWLQKAALHPRRCFTATYCLCSPVLEMFTLRGKQQQIKGMGSGVTFTFTTKTVLVTVETVTTVVELQTEQTR